MIENLISCDYGRYCSQTRVRADLFDGWYAVRVNDKTDGELSVEIVQLFHLLNEPSFGDLLACCPEHAEFVAQKAISKWMHARKTVVEDPPAPAAPEPVFPTPEVESDVQTDKPEDMPF